MTRYLLTLEYDGAAYAGWQRQKNAVGVQERVEEALGTLLMQKTVVYASGRTDAGVHAEGQAAHFDAPGALEVKRFIYSLNALLPDDIKARSLIPVPDDFHAQYSAKKKTYSYKIYVSETPSPLRRARFFRIAPPFDFDIFEKALAMTEGEHDFRSFGNTGSSQKTSVRTIYSARAVKNGGEITAYITGNGFLYNMVRVVAGAALAAAKGRIALKDIADMLGGAPRPIKVKTLPPHALTLVSVEYDIGDRRS